MPRHHFVKNSSAISNTTPGPLQFSQLPKFQLRIRFLDPPPVGHLQRWSSWVMAWQNEIPKTKHNDKYGIFWLLMLFVDFSQSSHHQWESLYTKLQPSNLAPDKVETTSQQYPNHIPWPPPSATLRRRLGRWQAASAATSAQPPEVGRLSELKLGVLHEHQLHQNFMYPFVCVVYLTI